MISIKVEGVYGVLGKVAIRGIVTDKQIKKTKPDVLTKSSDIELIVSDEYYMVQLPDDLKFRIEKCQLWQSGTFLISLKDGDNSESVAHLIKEHIKGYIGQHIKILSKSDLRDDILDELID